MFASILALNHWEPNLEIFIRWLHVIAGIAWIGHLYFFNFVNANFQPKIDKETKQKVNPELMPRALWWFRWGAMITLLAGLVLFSLVYMYKGNGKWGPNYNFTGIDGKGMGQRSAWILGGMILGIIMWFNVWFVIWPRQQKIIAAVKGGTAPDAAMVKTATLASKINTYLSGPMLFGMLGAGHYSAINAPTAIICIVLAEAVIWHFYKISAKTGANFQG